MDEESGLHSDQRPLFLECEGEVFSNSFWPPLLIWRGQSVSIKVHSVVLEKKSFSFFYITELGRQCLWDNIIPVFMNQRPNTYNSVTHTVSHKYWQGGCWSWVFNPPAVITAGWLTLCLIIYKLCISRCVPAAASGLLLALLRHAVTAIGLYLDVVIFILHTFGCCS